MKWIAYVLLALILGVILIAGGVYFYLVPESEGIPTADESTTRQAVSGEVVGFVRNGVATWLGIPFAAPPVGDMRWRAPRAIGHSISQRSDRRRCDPKAG